MLKEELGKADREAVGKEKNTKSFSLYATL